MAKNRIRYQTIEFKNLDVHVRTLWDNLQCMDEGGEADKLGISSAMWPVSCVIWDSARVLAHLMSDYDITGKRILGVGCGIALSSLVLNHRDADITATDHNPDVESFLLKNIKLNHGNAIPFIRTDWNEKNTSLGDFDLIIGSDLLYESDHAALLSDFINGHARKACQVIIVDPGRGQHARFSKHMVSLGYSHSQSKPEHSDYLDKPFKGQILRYSRK